MKSQFEVILSEPVAFKWVPNFTSKKIAAFGLQEAAGLGWVTRLPGAGNLTPLSPTHGWAPSTCSVGSMWGPVLPGTGSSRSTSVSHARKHALSVHHRRQQREPKDGHRVPWTWRPGCSSLSCHTIYGVNGQLLACFPWRAFSSPGVTLRILHFS
jgi:hypothetical protein